MQSLIHSLQSVSYTHLDVYKRQSMLKYAGDELTHVLFADTFNQTLDCRYIANPPWLNQRGKSDVTIHQHLAMGEGDVDFDGIFETLREMDFANRQLKADAPKVGGDNIACVSMFGFPEKMDKQAPVSYTHLSGRTCSKIRCHCRGRIRTCWWK